MKYIKVEWPEIQEYMERSDYEEGCHFDPDKNCWFIPETWVDPIADLSDNEVKELFEDMEADSQIATQKDLIW